MDINNILSEIANKNKSVFEHIIKEGFKDTYTFEIECDNLKDYNMEDIRESPEHSSLFNKLKSLKGPVLYIFEIISNFNALEIRTRITEFSKSENGKATPAIKNKISNSNILYIGKVQNDFWGRVIEHMGYNKNIGKQGLQLFQWSKSLGLKLKVTAIQFEHDAVDVLPVIEKSFAKVLNPILGKHK